VPRVFDCFTFFNELDVLEIRLAELDPLVDFFVLVEATRTFTGKPKPLYYADNRQRYERYTHKIIHVVVDDLPLDAPTHWIRESYQRDCIIRGLAQARPDDRILISDCDEIPKPDILRRALSYRGLSHRIVAFWCENYIYRLNLRNDDHDHRLGPRLLTMSSLRSPQKIREMQFRFSKRNYLRPFVGPVVSYRILRRLRTLLWPTILWNGSWHFTHMGDVATVNLKIVSDSHADEHTEMTEAEFNARLSQLVKTPLQELPATIRRGQFAHLIA
jgi:beta-1,4-mannosyl-glycoprotein beta-1,4-N-acetylglucosaminyltransferase